ncbi:MAG: hypothetical protein JO116_21300, partial [Planctomycetaceae bacterium]|nr:hypothetical protein [Planctomycetaceae bacterium]
MPIDQRDDSGLAVNQAELLVRQDADLKPARPEELEKPREAKLGGVAALLNLVFRPGGAPLHPQRGLGGPGGFDVARVQAGVADHTDLAFDRLQRLACDFQYRRREVAGDAVIRPGSLEP